MKNKTFCLSAAALLASVGMHAHAANLVTNGDFATNATAFSEFPGYANFGVNPAEIPDWIYTGSVQRGVNGTLAGMHNPFGPSDKSAASTWGFVQQAGSIAQSIVLQANTTYDISYLAASRSNNANARGQVTVSDNSTTYYDSGEQNWGTAAFQAISSQFSTGSTIDGHVVITLINTNTLGGDNTVNYSNVVVEVVPEPGSLALLGLGGLLIARRRRA
ncbi:MAG: DUF642 domain-containing protein [Phycisphaeraceae bacterium]